DRGDLPVGLAVPRAVPHEDEAVLLLHAVVPHAGLLRDPLGVGDLDALAVVALEAPRVERAADGLAHHLAAVAEVRAEVRAIRVEHVGLAALAAEEDHVTAEILDGLDLVRPELLGDLDDEPAPRISLELHHSTPSFAAAAAMSSAHL